VTAFDTLHPVLQYHLVNSLGWSSLRPTQVEAIAPIQQGRHCLLLAPTAGGKTEAAIIPVLSRMLRENWAGVSVLYVCPIKALLNNLALRLEHYAGLVGRRVELWHGDVSPSRKRRALRDPPDILLTTPESLEGMLISTRVERQVWFGGLRTVIVDELHAFAGDDRGWHLRSLLARLGRYVSPPPQRIGLSATVRNPDDLLAWFAPAGERQVVGNARVSTDADVTLDYVGSLENAATVIARLHQGRKRLVFCDSRSHAEQLSSRLRERGVRTFVSHASLSASERRQAEAAFAEERDCAIVTTSTLELGIDVGDLDHVIQIDAPATVSSFLQRMGRTGRRPDSRRNCLFLATYDPSFLLALGLVALWRREWVEAAVPPPEPWGVVAQQTLAIVLEQGQLPGTELLAQLGAGFPECCSQELGEAMTELARLGYLTEAGPGIVQIGPSAEREFGRRHYRDLLATFSGAPLLTARYGGVEIGYVDPLALVGQATEHRILLGGRSWTVRNIDWGRRVVTLEPATGGGRARWSGSGRVIGPEIGGVIRAVVESGHLEGVILSKRAALRLEELQGELPTGSHQPVVVRDARGRYRVWTFAGTLVNRLLAHQLRDGAGSRGYDELGVDTLRDPTSALSAALDQPVVLSADDLDRARESIKFSQCVPRRQLERMIYRRMLGLIAG
jgi:ATP-dependent Lhr-like helicase